MAASLQEMYPKRKLELEDITNRHKKAKQGKEYFHQSQMQPQPLQERSPSPSSPSSSSSPPSKQRSKSVSFELSKNEHYENSPLLTPKEDDFVSDTEYNQHRSESSEQQLDRNPDYVALGATADMLHMTKEKIEDDLAELLSSGRSPRSSPSWPWSTFTSVSSATTSCTTPPSPACLNSIASCQHPTSTGANTTRGCKTPLYLTTVRTITKRCSKG
ncbi:hypothetical protein CJJ09_005618 [Candidozyma auris]|nr:hypothetical protein CJJ09_005618 [[Candida] auris]